MTLSGPTCEEQARELDAIVETINPFGSIGIEEHVEVAARHAGSGNPPELCTLQRAAVSYTGYVVLTVYVGGPHRGNYVDITISSRVAETMLGKLLDRNATLLDVLEANDLEAPF